MTYSLESGKNFFTYHTLVNLTENVNRKSCWKKYWLWIVCTHLKPLERIDHDMLLSKPNLYGIRGVSNNWFRPFLFDCEQHASITLTLILFSLTVLYSDPALGPLLFLLCINDFYLAIQLCKVCHLLMITTYHVFCKSMK